MTGFKAAYFTRTIHATWAPGILRLTAPTPPPRQPQRDTLERKVAVLAFDNLGEGGQPDYLPDGFSEELICVLATVPGVRVTARASAFSLRGRNLPPAEIGRQLEVDFLVEGRAGQVAGQVQIAARLVRIADQRILWSDRIERGRNEIPTVRDEFATQILRALQPALGRVIGVPPTEEEIRAQVRAAHRGGTRHAEAYHRYLQGRYLNEQGTGPSYALATAALREAIACDPGFALAWSELARNQLLLVHAEGIARAEGYEAARRLALRAVAIEPRLAEAHALLSRVLLMWDWYWREAKQAADQALRLEPYNPRVLRISAAVARAVGTFPHALELHRRSRVVDPLSPPMLLGHAHTLLILGHHAQAEELCERAIDLRPDYSLGHWRLAVLRYLRGHPDETAVLATSIPDEAMRLAALALALPTLGRREQALRSLADLEEKFGFRCALQIAEVRAQRGDVHAAFQWLERAADEKHPGMTHARISPLLRPLHSDPRWQLVMLRLNLANRRRR